MFREVLGTGIPCFRRQNVGTSCYLDVKVHESMHPADLFESVISSFDGTQH